MKRPIKIFLAVLILLGLSLLVWFVARQPAPPASGAITLPDGSWVHLEAVTYGTNHLVGPRLAFVAARMPPSVQNFMRKYVGRRAMIRFSYTSSSPTLVLWLNRDVSATAFPTNRGHFECALSDASGAVGGGLVPYVARYPLETKEFPVFPRRDPKITLTIYYHDSTGAVFNRGSLVFPNPEYRRYAHWTPEPLPATKHAGDVAVTLEKVFAGMGQPVEFKESSSAQQLVFTTNAPAGTETTICNLRLHPANSNELWRAISVATSDATGNRIVSKTFLADNDAGYVMFSPALWPGEPAWKLNFEITRATGFSQDELVTFCDVPLRGLNAANQLGWKTNCQGVQLTLEQIARRESPKKSDSEPRPEFELRIGVAGATNDTRVDLISAVTDAGTGLVRRSLSDEGTNQVHRFDLPPVAAQRANFTFAVQRSRWVEFLVKPETETARLLVAPSK